MSNKSKIGWTDRTWNPVSGCTPISDGCDHCYAKRQATRLKAMGSPGYQAGDGFEVTCHPEALLKPNLWKKPYRVFACSMSDLFHYTVPDDFIRDVFQVMIDCNWLRFQVLTKRPERMAERVKAMGVHAKNIWYGVTVEAKKYKSRIDILRGMDVDHRFISFEPLLDDVELEHRDLNDIDWVIVGGESGPGAREMQAHWLMNVGAMAMARTKPIPFFFKQWGGYWGKENTLQGKKYEQFPEGLEGMK